jgi:hypothetical protein
MQLSGFARIWTLRKFKEFGRSAKVRSDNFPSILLGEFGD